MGSILDPEGAKWTVRRRCLPWRPRRKMPDDWGFGDASFGNGDDIISIVLNIALVVLLLAVDHRGPP
ncbi:hypothetical protein [Mycobacterium sp. DL440]|uniref:hypothetical protein n=1 Tax=Mycobacterium sp. DL440 TaxID=2675523 RepID=UPI001423206F|nr:hypothetical protein [Mycobacterium sp. DL440]